MTNQKSNEKWPRLVVVTAGVVFAIIAAVVFLVLPCFLGYQIMQADSHASTSDSLGVMEKRIDVLEKRLTELENKLAAERQQADQ